MSKELKELLKTDFAKRLEGVDGCVLIDYQGINAEQTLDLRKQLRKEGVRMKVVHNRLVKRVLADMEAPEDFREFFRGPVAILVGEDGAVTASKRVAEWSKKNKELAPIKGGMLEGKTLSPEDVRELAKLPDQPTLQAQVTGMLLGPLTHLASCAKSLVSHFAGCTKAHHESQGGEE